MRHLVAFVAVAEKCSFKAAAEELGRTQPSITLSIQQLEDVAGLKLLERTTRKVVPTAEGERFIPVAKKLVRDFESALSDLVATAEGRVGHVGLAVNPSVASKILPHVIKTFSKRYPNISVHVSDGNSAQVQNRIARNEVDFGISGVNLLRPELQYEPIMEDCLELVCGYTHPLVRAKSALKWSQIGDIELLDSGLRDLIPNGVLAKMPKHEFSTTSTLFAMIRANVGVAVLPTLAAAVDDQAIVSRKLSSPTVKREICIVSRKDSTLSPPAQLFMNLLLEQMPEIVASLNLPNVRLRGKRTA